MTFSMYRPESRLSNTVSGFVAGKSDPHGRFLGNVKARIVMALDNLQAAKKKNNITKFMLFFSLSFITIFVMQLGKFLYLNSFFGSSAHL